MSITPLSAVTYMNQNTQTNSVQQANSQQRLDFAAVVNEEIMREEEEKIKEVRPTEEIAEVDPDNQREQEQEEEEEEEEEEQAEEQNEEESAENEEVAASAATNSGKIVPEGYDEDGHLEIDENDEFRMLGINQLNLQA